MVRFVPGRLRGRMSVPGDKSISHRALIAAASLGAPSRIGGINPGADVAATLAALQSLGAQIAHEPDGAVCVRGGALHDADVTIDCANSGTTARMLLGVCAGAGLRARLDGDASLLRRPMEPVAAQLRAFGARIDTTDGHLPLDIDGASDVQTRAFILLAPSAQVKSALLFAALYAGVSVTIAGDRGSRDHTERLLRFLGADVRWDGKRIEFEPRALRAGSIDVPGDLSSAAFFITAATIAPASSLAIDGVCVNPTRTGLIDALRRMGADISLSNERDVGGEPVADIEVRSAPLRAITIDADLALRAIDEIPLLAVAAAFAAGTTTIAGIKDLRTKESDRIAAIEGLLALAGIRATPTGPNAMEIEGGRPSVSRDALAATTHDHRITMAAAVLACAGGPISVDDARSIAVSFPGFCDALAAAQA